MRYLYPDWSMMSHRTEILAILPGLLVELRVLWLVGVFKFVGVDFQDSAVDIP